MRTLIICDYGYKIKVRNGVIMAIKKGQKPINISPALYDQIIIATSKISISSKALRLLAIQGIDVVILDSKGSPVGRLYPLIIIKTVETRKAQYLAMINGKGLQAIKNIIEAKIRNQAAVIKYFSKTRKLPELREEAYGLEIAADRIHQMKNPTPQKLMEEEAWAARKYWVLVSTLLPEDYQFKGRDHNSSDSFNLMLNYGYGILYYIIEKALLLVGLDPYGGFLHREKSGKTTLVFDFIEQFRPVAVDKPLITLAQHFKPDIIHGFLSYDSRKIIATQILENLQKRHVFKGRKIPLEQIILIKARELANYLKGKQKEYEGYKAWW